MMTKRDIRDSGGIIVYDGGSPIGILHIDRMRNEDTWGGARICQNGEWKKGEIEYRGQAIPVMSDGDETYAVYSY